MGVKAKGLMGDLKSHFESILNGGATPRPAGTTIRPASSDATQRSVKNEQGDSSMRIRVCIVIASVLILLLFGYMLRKPAPSPEQQMFDDFIGDEARTNRKDLRERESMSPRIVVRTDPLFQEFDD